MGELPGVNPAALEVCTHFDGMRLAYVADRSSCAGLDQKRADCLKRPEIDICIDSSYTSVRCIILCGDTK